MRRKKGDTDECFACKSSVRGSDKSWRSRCYTGKFGMSTATSLNLRALLKAAVARSGMDAPAHIVSGLTDSAKALVVAAAAQAQPATVHLYIVPSDADLEQACADASFFLAALEGLTAAATEHAVLSFPSHEVDPYRGLAPHVGVTSRSEERRVGKECRGWCAR